MKKLKIIYTSDLHGALFPENKGGSLLQCVGQFEKDGNTLILDGGDNLQGSPILRFISESSQFDSLLAPVYNYGKYDYFTLGNHDFDHGYDKLKSFVTAMDATCLCANVTDPTDALPIRPYEIRTMKNGLRVGIAGLVTDFVTVWHSEDSLGNIQMADSFTTAKECNLALKNDCDLKICIYHGGFEEDLDTGEVLRTSSENIACRICRELDFDILLTAHQHNPLIGRYYYGTYVMQLPPRGKMYGELMVEMASPMMSITSQFVEPSVFLPPSLVDLLLFTKEQTDFWLSQELCYLQEPLISSSDKITQAIKGCPLADLVNMVQLYATRADISCTSLPNAPIHIPEVVTVGDIIKAFPHLNSLVVVEITGEILYQALVETASYLLWTPKGFQVDPYFLSPKEAHHRFDFYGNLRYTVLCNPSFVENQVSQVMIGTEPLDLDRSYRMAMTDYRASGSSGYEFYGDCPVVDVCDKDLQRLIIEFFQAHMPRKLPPLHGLTVKT